MSALVLDAERVTAFRARILADAFLDASAIYWLRRADELEAAAHRPGIDFPGTATPEQLAIQRHRCFRDAAACRHRATLERDLELPVPPMVWALLGEGVSSWA